MLGQHSNVAFVTRLSDRAYRVHRVRGNDVVVALSQEYEMTADAVRTAFEHHKPFDVLFKTNPYGRISSQGQAAAETLGIEVLNAHGLWEYLTL
jgi:hypothetical protein